MLAQIFGSTVNSFTTVTQNFLATQLTTLQNNLIASLTADFAATNALITATNVDLAAIDALITATNVDLANIIASLAPFDTLVTETEVTINLINNPLALFVPVAGKKYQAFIRNTSTAGQLIRIGNAPAFGAPNVGMLLNLNDVILIENFNYPLKASTSADGALLSLFVLRQV